MTPRQSVPFRMAKYTRPDPETGCWLWTAAVSRPHNGYGAIDIDGKTCKAHRVAYELRYGAIPDGLVIDHLCRVTTCVNPDHLEAVTHAENMARGSRAQQTHCKHGHEFTPENTYTTRHPSGTTSRKCRECTLARPRNQRAAA